jgi:hypothetical protein
MNMPYRVGVGEPGRVEQIAVVIDAEGEAPVPDAVPSAVGRSAVLDDVRPEAGDERIPFADHPEVQEASLGGEAVAHGGVGIEDVRCLAGSHHCVEFLLPAEGVEGEVHPARLGEGGDLLPERLDLGGVRGTVVHDLGRVSLPARGAGDERQNERTEGWQRNSSVTFHPRRPPAAIPLMKCFCARKKIRMLGSMISTAPAIRSCQGVLPVPIT